MNYGFQLQGDTMRNSAVLLPELVAAGVRLLVFAGNADVRPPFRPRYLNHHMGVLPLLIQAHLRPGAALVVDVLVLSMHS